MPLTLLLPPLPRRLVGVYGLLGLHVGIGLGMSVRVGLVFLTTLPSYIHGFGCEAAVGSSARCTQPFCCF